MRHRAKKFAHVVDKRLCGAQSMLCQQRGATTMTTRLQRCMCGGCNDCLRAQGFNPGDCVLCGGDAIDLDDNGACDCCNEIAAEERAAQRAADEVA